MEHRDKNPAARGADDQRLPTHRGLSMQKDVQNAISQKRIAISGCNKDERVSCPLTLLLTPGLKSLFEVGTYHFQSF